MTFLACLAHQDFLHPFGLKDLVCSQAAVRMRIENRVDDISALPLYVDVSIKMKYGMLSDDLLFATPQWAGIPIPPCGLQGTL